MEIDKYTNFRLFNPIPLYSPETYRSRQTFEQYFYKFYLKNRDKFPSDVEYISVFWHSYENCHFLSTVAPSYLKNLLSSLDKDKKYFTICSHYSGIRHSLPKNTTVFSSATLPSDTITFRNRRVRSNWHESNSELEIIKIPLIKHPLAEINKGNVSLNEEGISVSLASRKEGGPGKKTVLCSFIGAHDTHPCRGQIIENLKKAPKQKFKTVTYSWRQMHEWKACEKIYPSWLNQSTFTLCPRGFGPTSYRLYEAMQMGSVPVYIHSDPAFLPYEDEINWDDICVMIPISRIEDMQHLIMLKTKEDIAEYKNNISKIYSDYFTREGVCEYILRTLTKNAT